MKISYNCSDFQLFEISFIENYVFLLNNENPFKLFEAFRKCIHVVCNYIVNISKNIINK